MEKWRVCSTAAQQSLLNYVSGGGGLVTTEWTVLDIDGAGQLQTLQAAIPVSLTTTFGSALTLTYGQSTANVFLNHGVSSSFTFTTDSLDGSETDFLPKTGATVYYTSSGGTSSNGLIGWKYGAGEVLSFSTLAGPTELSNSNYAQLFVNAVNFAGGETAVVPEPSRLTALAGLGGMCLVGLAWRLRRR